MNDDNFFQHDYEQIDRLTTQQRLERVEKARQRTGICSNCGNPISEARLKAVRFTDKCLDCVRQCK